MTFANPRPSTPRHPFHKSRGLALLAVGLLAGASLGCRFQDGGDDTSGGTTPTGPQPLTIVTWNVENFVNDVRDSTADQEAVDPGWVGHRQAVGKVLAAIDADIVMLQEVEHAAGLQQLSDMELDGRYPYIRVVDGNDPRGIDVGILSKVEFDEAISHKSEVFAKLGTSSPTYRYARDCLEVRYSVAGRDLVLLGVHYKAKDNDNPDKRLAEAQHTRWLADGIVGDNPNAAVMILGDFNDTPGSPPYQATVGADPQLYNNAADVVVADDRWTFNYGGNLELVDHMMGNPAMHELLDQGSAHIIHSADVNAASDHAPIVATYVIE